MEQKNFSTQQDQLIAESSAYQRVDPHFVELPASNLLPLTFFAIAAILYLLSKKARTNL